MADADGLTLELKADDLVGSMDAAAGLELELLRMLLLNLPLPLFKRLALLKEALLPWLLPKTGVA